MNEVKDKVTDPSSTNVSVYIGLEHLGAGTGRIDSFGDPASVTSAKTVFAPGDVLFGKLRPYLKKTAVAPVAGLCSTDVLALRATDALTPAFLHLLVSSDAVQRRAEETSKGTRMPRTSYADIATTRVALPTLPEQRRMVDLVAAMEREHGASDKVEAAAERLLGSLRDTLVTGPLRLLGDLIDTIDGGTSPLTEGRPPVPGEPAVIKLSAIRAGRFNSAEAKAVTATALPGSAAIRRGDVLITRSNTPDRVGDVAYVDADYPLLYLSDLTLRIRPRSDDLDPEYLTQALLSSVVRSAVRASASGTSSSMKKISRSKIREYRIPVPALSDQRAAAETLRAVTSVIVSLEKKRQALASVRSCVVQSLLDGEHAIPDTYDALLASTG